MRKDSRSSAQEIKVTLRNIVLEFVKKFSKKALFNRQHQFSFNIQRSKVMKEALRFQWLFSFPFFPSLLECHVQNFAFFTGAKIMKDNNMMFVC